MKLLLERNARVNEQDVNKYYPIHYACQGKIEVVKLLLDNKAMLRCRETKVRVVPPIDWLLVDVVIDSPYASGRHAAALRGHVG